MNTWDGVWRGIVRRLAVAGAAVAALAVIGVQGCKPTEAEQQAARREHETGYRGVALSNPLPKVDFTLTDTEGEPFHFLEETEGDVTLLFFGYTNCPDVCPVHMASIAAVMKNFSWDVRNQIKVVFVTTDPERDTPERIREWLDRFDPSFIGLRGPKETVDSIMAQYKLPPAILQKEGADDDDYIVGHASQVIAFTKDNKAHLIYPFGTRQADWANDLPRLVVHGWPGPEGEED